MSNPTQQRTLKCIIHSYQHYYYVCQLMLTVEHTTYTQPWWSCTCCCQTSILEHSAHAHPSASFDIDISIYQFLLETADEFCLRPAPTDYVLGRCVYIVLFTYLTTEMVPVTPLTRTLASSPVFKCFMYWPLLYTYVHYGHPIKDGRPLYFRPVVSFFFFFSSPNLSGRRLDVYHTSTHGVALVQI